ncbi:MAG: Fis family transcriptional regulator [Betaproteobacteria bacterium]|nr:Fis family transcriptional regulator [Betaproteobacteria bacterium]
MVNKESEIARCVRQAMAEYFKDLDGEQPRAIYEMVIGCVDKPLIEFVLEYAQGNQAKAAGILGVSRNTLRKKMLQYGIK